MKFKLLSILMISGSALITSSVSGAEADEPAAAKAAEKNQETATSIIEAYNKEYHRVRLLILPEKDIPKRMARFRKELPKPTEPINRIIQLAKDNPQAEGIQKGLLWAMKKTLSPKSQWSLGQRKEITNLFLTHYKDDAAMLDLTLYYAKPVPGGQEAIDALRKISEKATDQKIAFEATYYVANRLMQNAATKQEGLTAMKNLAATPKLKDIAPNILTQAKGEILEAQQLQVGNVAPDIVGTDQEGKEFKLSDYRGKVVLLHFWAMW